MRIPFRRKKKQCPRCGGSGRYATPGGIYNSGQSLKTKCTRCKGKGKIPG